ncbi:PREDICTED: alpha-2-macroglobulin-like protein 1 [Pterocles gutturalis]|uniref:alpha-2-macroglobulin-like protein 1 n=1 Tax=Pterocles gutturalis TaxID=240206 RepID=UPI0005290051|nr:PREDICTED: alpha-2-macroglobulin-like protein 1 [Pterocles gutturalis]
MKMWTPILLNCLLYMLGIVAQPRYLIIIPAALPYPSSQRVCLDLRGVEKPIRVALTLTHPSGNLSLYRKVVRNNWIFECSRFQVPQPAGSQEVGTVHMHISNGHYFSANEKKQVLIRRAGTGTFIQMDKSVYNPGQTVKFRIVTLTEDFTPINTKYSVVEVQDPNQNRIGQWLDVRPKQGIADLSFQLAPELSLGTYTISVLNPKVSSTFKVEERVLQKFDVFFDGPAQIHASDKTFPLRVCGRYSYGKAVQGTMRVTLCQKARRRPRNASKDICREYSGPTVSKGCFTTSVSTSVFNLAPSEEDSKLYAEASLLEKGTGVQINTSSQILISRTAARAVFETPNVYYIPGIPYRGKIKLQDHYGNAMKNRKVYLVIKFMRRRFIKTYITDGSGIASFNLDTTAWNSSSVSLEGRFTLEDLMPTPQKTDFSYTNAYHHLQPFHVTTKSFLDIHPLTETLPCGLKQDVQVTFTLSRDDLGEDTSRIGFAYYVTGKAGIVVRGQRSVKVGKLNMLQGSFSIPLTFTADFTPSPSLVVYAIFPNGGVTADSIRFDVALCFENQVKVGFPAKEAHPGSTVQLLLQAAPGSLCAVQAVDENMFFMRPESELTSQTVYGLFPAAYRHGYPAQVEERSDHCVQPQSTSSLLRGKPQHSFQPDIFNLFRNMGLKIFSNLVIKKPSQCFHRVDRKLTVGAHSTEDQRINKEQPQFTTHGRLHHYFPETWIWNLFSVGSNGSRSVPVTVPAAAAEWKVKTFCVAARGFGLAPTVSLRTVQPFFVDVTLPYSVIQGETFVLKATVFSYLQQCIQIHVALAKSSDFRVEPCWTCRDKECLCAEESKTFKWSVTAVQLGTLNITVRTEILDNTPGCRGRKPLPATVRRRHVLVKHLLVRLEGVLVEKTYGSLLCLKGGNVAEEPVSLRLPYNVIKGSARASITVSGDLMGTALQNLDRLVQMPHGCGEQNMVLFAPIVYVLQYLEKTRQLTPEIKERATRFLRKGYQMQLLYRCRDGSYSVFGQQDGEGNTWLTAFVVKSFSQARKYIYVDDKNVQDALRWLEQTQLPTGCFATKGSLFHSSLKGSVDDEISLGAYVAAALLELGLPLKGKLMQTTLHCLQQAVHNITDIYTEAVLAYAFALAGDYETTQELLYKLEEQAIKSGGQIHWSPKPSSPASSGFWPGTQSVDIELTAYVLLAYLSKPRVHAGDMTTAAGIVAWLTQQQNAYGGFASTQDTVVALQALAKYAARTFSASGQALVRVKSQRGFGKAFQVNRQKRLLVQQAALTEVPGQFLVQVHGSSCVFTQTVLRYHEPPSQAAVTFTLRVNTELTNCSQANAHVLTVRILASYIGSRVTSNMVIVEVSLLSGFILAPESRMLLERRTIVKKIEVKADVVYVYLDKLNDESQTFILQLEQVIHVKNLKSAIIKVYDYYQPEERALADYSAVCS